MISPADVPYSDPEPFAELMEECRCAQEECEAHRVEVHLAEHPHANGGPVSVDEKTQHLVDGYSDYGG